MKDTRPLVVVSTGRTGTIFFARLLAELYPQVSSHHEYGWSRPVQILSNMYFARLIPKSLLVLGWKFFKGKDLIACQKPVWIENNSFLYGLIAVAPEVYPGVRVLHLVRDPRTYVTSHLNFSRFRPTSFIANYFVPMWQPSPFLTGEIPWKEYFTFTRFQRFCWIWDFKNRVIRRLESSGVPYLRMRFEDIFYAENPEQVFAEIADFFGLPRVTNIGQRFRQPVNAAPKNSFPEWPEWTPAQCAQLDTLCGKQMREFGYGSEPAWLEKLAQAASLKQL